ILGIDIDQPLHQPETAGVMPVCCIKIAGTKLEHAKVAQSVGQLELTARVVWVLLLNTLAQRQSLFEACPRRLPMVGTKLDLPKRGKRSRDIELDQELGQGVMPGCGQFLAQREGLQEIIACLARLSQPEEAHSDARIRLGEILFYPGGIKLV